MVTNSKLKHVVVTIGAATGRTERTAQKVARAGMVAKKKLVAISKQVEALKRQLLNNTEGPERCRVVSYSGVAAKACEVL